MKEDNISDVFVWGPAILIVVALCVLLTCQGCSSTCPPPEIRTVEVQVPVYSCPSPPELPETLLPFRERLFGLTIAPEQLHLIRQERRPGSNYAALETCRREVAAAERWMAAGYFEWHAYSRTGGDRHGS